MPLRDDFQLPPAVFSSSNGRKRLWGTIFSRKLPSAGRNMPAPRSPVPAIGQRWPIRVIPAKSQTRNASKRPVLLKISRDRPTLAYHRQQARNLVGILSAEALPAPHVAACYRFTPSRLRHLPANPDHTADKFYPLAKSAPAPYPCDPKAGFSPAKDNIDL